MKDIMLKEINLGNSRLKTMAQKLGIELKRFAADGFCKSRIFCYQNGVIIAKLNPSETHGFLIGFKTAINSHPPQNNLLENKSI